MPAAASPSPLRLFLRDHRAMGAVVVAGLACTLGLFFTLRGWERRTAQAAVAAAAGQRIELLHETLSNSLEALHSLGGLFQLDPTPDRERFRRLVEPVLARR
ncbi:MAG: hypothetical protein H7067_10110, partial [Burkholderiales bacterium]|nr:hypothetical protein [Opitutaceae bacterium]